MAVKGEDALFPTSAGAKQRQHANHCPTLKKPDEFHRGEVSEKMGRTRMEQARPGG